MADGEWISVGLMECNPHKMIIRFRDSPERLIIEKKDFADLIRGRITESIRIFSRDPSQSVLIGEAPSQYAGKAEVTKSGKAIRLVLENGRKILYLNLSKAMDVLEKRESSCSISMVVSGA